VIIDLHTVKSQIEAASTGKRKIKILELRPQKSSSVKKCT
jgi:hypothetical protein